MWQRRLGRPFRRCEGSRSESACSPPRQPTDVAEDPPYAEAFGGACAYCANCRGLLAEALGESCVFAAVFGKVHDGPVLPGAWNAVIRHSRRAAVARGNPAPDGSGILPPCTTRRTAGSSRIGSFSAPISRIGRRRSRRSSWRRFWSLGSNGPSARRHGFHRVRPAITRRQRSANAQCFAQASQPTGLRWFQSAAVAGPKPTINVTLKYAKRTEARALRPAAGVALPRRIVGSGLAPCAVRTAPALPSAARQRVQPPTPDRCRSPRLPRHHP